MTAISAVVFMNATLTESKKMRLSPTHQATTLTPFLVFAYSQNFSHFTAIEEGEPGCLVFYFEVDLSDLPSSWGVC